MRKRARPRLCYFVRVIIVALTFYKYFGMIKLLKADFVIIVQVSLEGVFKFVKA